MPKAPGTGQLQRYQENLSTNQLELWRTLTDASTVKCLELGPLSEAEQLELNKIKNFRLRANFLWMMNKKRRLERDAQMLRTANENRTPAAQADDSSAEASIKALRQTRARSTSAPPSPDSRSLQQTECPPKTDPTQDESITAGLDVEMKTVKRNNGGAIGNTNHSDQVYDDAWTTLLNLSDQPNATSVSFPSDHTSRPISNTAPLTSLSRPDNTTGIATSSRTRSDARSETLLPNMPVYFIDPSTISLNQLASYGMRITLASPKTRVDSLNHISSPKTCRRATELSKTSPHDFSQHTPNVAASLQNSPVDPPKKTASTSDSMHNPSNLNHMPTSTTQFGRTANSATSVKRDDQDKHIDVNPPAFQTLLSEPEWRKALIQAQGCPALYSALKSAGDGLGFHQSHVVPGTNVWYSIRDVSMLTANRWLNDDVITASAHQLLKGLVGIIVMPATLTKYAVGNLLEAEPTQDTLARAARTFIASAASPWKSIVAFICVHDSHWISVTMTLVLEKWADLKVWDPLPGEMEKTMQSIIATRLRRFWNELFQIPGPFQGVRCRNIVFPSPPPQLLQTNGSDCGPCSIACAIHGLRSTVDPLIFRGCDKALDAFISSTNGLDMRIALVKALTPSCDETTWVTPASRSLVQSQTVVVPTPLPGARKRRQAQSESLTTGTVKKSKTATIKDYLLPEIAPVPKISTEPRRTPPCENSPSIEQSPFVRRSTRVRNPPTRLGYNGIPHQALSNGGAFDDLVREADEAFEDSDYAPSAQSTVHKSTHLQNVSDLGNSVKVRSNDILDTSDDTLSCESDGESTFSDQLGEPTRTSSSNTAKPPTPKRKLPAKKTPAGRKSRIIGRAPIPLLSSAATPRPSDTAEQAKIRARLAKLELERRRKASSEAILTSFGLNQAGCGEGDKENGEGKKFSFVHRFTNLTQTSIDNPRPIGWLAHYNDDRDTGEGKLQLDSNIDRHNDHLRNSEGGDWTSDSDSEIDHEAAQQLFQEESTDDLPVEEPDLDTSNDPPDEGPLGEEEWIDEIHPTELSVDDGNSLDSNKDRLRSGLKRAIKTVHYAARALPLSQCIEYGWVRRAMLFARSLSISGALHVVMEAMKLASPVINTDQFTIQDLMRHLPKLDRQTHLGCRGVYALMGRHVDGRTAMYIGSSKDLHRRLQDHRSAISKVRAGTSLTSKDIPAYKTLGSPGWTYGARILATFAPKIHPCYSYLAETCLMILMGCISPDSSCLRTGLAELITSIGTPLAPKSIVVAALYIGLNRQIPLRQNWAARDQRLRQCCNCGAEVKKHPYFAPVGHAFDLDAYICNPCYSFNYYNGTYPDLAMLVETERRHAFMSVALADRKCHVCHAVTLTKYSINFAANDPFDAALCKSCYNSAPERKQLPKGQRQPDSLDRQCSHCKRMFPLAKYVLKAALCMSCQARSRRSFYNALVKEAGWKCKDCGTRRSSMWNFLGDAIKGPLCRMCNMRRLRQR